MEERRANSTHKIIKDEDMKKEKEESKTLASDGKSLPSYGTLDSKADLKRFCLKTPYGKMVYAH